MQLPDTIQPTLDGTGVTKEANVREVKFGGNYTQRTGCGINCVRQTWNLTWQGTEAQVTELDDFFEARAGWDSFTWTPPRHSSALKFTCKAWGRSYQSDVNNKVDTLTAAFEQQFDLNE